MRLFKEVAKVDSKEAEQGAMHSDSFKTSSKKDDGLSGKGLTNRLSKLWLDLKTKKAEKPKTPEEDCPIAKARAESETGENAPLGWLTLDHVVGQENGAPSYEHNSLNQPRTAPSKEVTSLSFLQPDPDDADYMFNEEWFLSPCG